MTATHGRASFGTIKRAILRNEERPQRIGYGFYAGVIRRMNLRHTLQVKLGLWERETYPYLDRALAADWVIDVGAGMGEMAAVFALRSKADPIYAIEPKGAADIEETLRLSGASGVTVVTEFIGEAFPLDGLELPQGRGFIKIDVDGVEREVLRSGARLLSERRPWILLETHSAELEQECRAFLNSLGYCCTIIPNAWWRKLVPEQRDWSDHNRWLWAE